MKGYFAVNRRQLIFIASVLTIAAFFSLIAAFAGRRLLISGHFWPTDILWGSDVVRNITNMTEPGMNDRSNVHPLFAATVRPFALLIQAFGVTRGISAILLNAAAGALGLIILAAYLRLRAVARVDTLLVVLLVASSATWLLQSAVPGTYIFSVCMIGLTQLLTLWGLRRPDDGLTPGSRIVREAAWFVTGVLNYGFTVTNGFMSFLSYGFARRGIRGWVRAAVYGGVVLAAGIALGFAAGSYMHYEGEQIWLYDNATRGWTPYSPTLVSISSNLFWSYVLPLPTWTQTNDARQWQVLTFLYWNYTKAGWLLVSAMAMMVAAAAWAALADRDPISRRLSALLAGCLLFHILIHTVYFASFEGMFVFTGHGLFLTAGLLAPLMVRIGRLPRAYRTALRVALALFIAAIAWRHIDFLLNLGRLVPLPPGYGK